MLWAFISLLIRSGLIMGAAVLLRHFPARSGAARHRILAVGFALLLSWPLCSAVLPAFHLPLLLHSGDGTVTVTQRIVSSAGGKTTTVMNWLLLLWAAGALVALARIALAFWRVRRMTALGRRINEPAWQELLAQLCRELRISRPSDLVASSCALVPFTSGLFHARIVLPQGFEIWPENRRRIVLLHELMHIRRHDLHWQFLATVTTALWWFQPLCWINMRTMRRDSETACDAWIVDTGIRPSDYASELLKVAEGLAKRTLTSPVAIAIAEPGQLEHRIRTILDARVATTGKFPARAIALLAAVTISVSALTLSPDKNDSQGGPQMKRTLISGLLLSAGLIAAPHTHLTADDSKAKTQAANDQNDHPVRVSGEFEQAKLIHKVNPTYPPAAKAAGVQGQVRLDVTISKEGVPEQIQVLSSPNDDLTQSATEAVRQWRYETTLLNGKPVAVIAEVLVNYTLAK
jgi:TonB family protein